MRLFIIAFLLLAVGANGQALQGVVTDATTGKPIYLVSVVNRTTGETVTTGTNGVYSLHAAAGNPIAFSSVGYAPEIRYCQPSVLVGTINVALEPADNQLKEFVVKKSRWTKYQIDSAERATTYKIPLQRKPPSPLASPFSAIAEKFSKKAKRTYEFQKVFAAGEVEKFIDTRYTPALVQKLTGATGDTIGHFMYAYPMPYDFARTGSDLEIKMWIRTSYRKWVAEQAADTAIK